MEELAIFEWRKVTALLLLKILILNINSIYYLFKLTN